MEFPEDDGLAGENPFEGQPQKSIFPEDFGRESLGILDFNNVDFGRESLAFDFQRESLGIVNLNTVDLGRESLGICSLNFDALPPIYISDLTGSSTSFSELDRGFCVTPKPPRSCSTLESFLSRYGSVPSTICPPDLPIAQNTKNHALRLSPNYSTMSCLGPASKTDDNKATRRICSAPADLEQGNEIQPLPDRGTHFDDAVFIEGSHLAAKITDGSFYELGPGEVDYNLDSIQAPENFIHLSDSPSDGEITSIDATVSNGTDTIFSSPKVLPDTLSKISSENRSKVKTPMEVLESLSNMLNQDEFTDNQKIEGKLLINSLAELLLANREAASLNDSGHSSIDEQPLNLVSDVKCYEILDLRKVTLTDSEDTQPLDLSLKLKESDKVFVSPKILPRKFNICQPKNYSISSNESSTDSGRLKIRKSETKISGKGPMKATVQLVPVKNDNSLSNLPNSKSKKIATPVRENAFPRPVAHSTPDNPSSSSNKVKTDSPLRPKQKLNYSPLNSFSKSIKKPEIKRRSFNDLRASEGIREKFSRSYSLGEKPVSSSKTNRMTLPKLLQKNQANVLKENLRPRLSGSAMPVGKKLGKENVKRV